MQQLIHHTAIIESGAKLGKECIVGAFCYIDKHVTLGNNVTLESHVVIMGRTWIGDNTCIASHASIGEEPQHSSCLGEPTSVIIGAGCVIEKKVTIHRAISGSGTTRIGNYCTFKESSHVGHDVVIGNNVSIGHRAGIGGHVEIDDNATIGDYSGLHQFIHVGEGALIGELTRVTRNVMPYGVVINQRSTKK